MPDFQLTEPIITALKDRLQAGLPAELASIAAGLPADEAEGLRPPDQVLDYIPTVGDLRDFPVIGLEDASSRFEDDTGGSLTGRHEIGIVVFCSDSDQRLLAWSLRRYQQAIMRVALAGRTLGTGSPLAAWGVGAVAIDPGPTLNSSEDPRIIMSFSRIRIWTRRDEIA